MRSTNNVPGPSEAAAADPSMIDQRRAEPTSQPALDLSRDELIRLAAYAAAERRGFEPGREVEDWLDAEREVDARLAPQQGPGTS